MRIARRGEVVKLRQHGIVLVRPFAQALVVFAAGVVVLAQPGRAAPAGALFLFAGSLLCLRATWRWERTLVRIADGQVALVRGTLRRRTAAVPLERVSRVEVEQSLLGRLLGYGTLVVADLELRYVARPREVEHRIAAAAPPVRA
jgi:uncharacterized membrane protein YdbT with pleckstrin-like domain